MELTTLALVAFGGGVGAVLRYTIAQVGQSLTSTSFPLGTLIVNILGCALIGLISAMLIGPLSQHREVLRLLLVVGVLGGFTTYSSFALDSFVLFDGGKIGQALLYIVLTNTIGLFAAWGCYRLGSAIFITTQS
jgi:CrcB protein